MGIYAYKALGKTFDVSLDGVPVRARMAAYWTKPYWEPFECAISGGTCPRFWSDGEKRLYRKYKQSFDRLEKTEAVRILVLSEGERKVPGEGDLVLVYPEPRRWVYDDPNWDNAEIRALHKTNSGWEACKPVPVCTDTLTKA